MMTAYAIFSAMLAFKPIYALSNMILSYLIFVLYLRSIPMLGAVWSFSFSAVLCVAIYLARYKDILFEISQIKIVDDIKFKWLNIPKNLSPEQYELIREKAGYITFEWDIQKDCIYFSKEINDYFDYPATIAPFADFVDKLELISDDQKVLLYECMDNVKKGVNFQKRDLHFPVKTGEERWFEARIITQKDNRNEPLLGIGILADVTEVRERITLLEKESRMDLFTGLYNRASIEHYGDRKLQELEQEEVLGMMIMDVDDFKNINDQYGHPVGDYVLKKMADLMRQKAPKGARVGRLGGDEFIVLYVTKDIEEFCDYAKEVLSEIASIKWQDREIKPQCSIGLSAASCNECSYAQLYERADKALYDAKNNGKNQLKCDLSEKLLHQRQ
ncbi:GGDEF domain-containing protein [Anaerotignum lactatifermentans]|uniref:sensor domain-containing diguanylate cyclase n=1 Tax=Anaerotignum lactatifermentans TaxID=160404 RepID=UPI0019604D12|nr:GGDEF domain-containing protein [Anaerotignum lactatifermentans]MBM6951809.1 GGDEF domain-containing protein [Anaerotignum lactatifermentans]